MTKQEACDLAERLNGLKVRPWINAPDGTLIPAKEDSCDACCTIGNVESREAIKHDIRSKGEKRDSILWRVIYHEGQWESHNVWTDEHPD